MRAGQVSHNPKHLRTVANGRSRVVWRAPRTPLSKAASVRDSTGRSLNAAHFATRKSGVEGCKTTQ
jgi:hypothetical protein